MSAKQQILKVIRESASDLTFEEAIYKLEVIRKIELGTAQLDRGEGIDHDELFRELLTNGKANSDPLVAPRKRRSPANQKLHPPRKRKSKDRQ